MERNLALELVRVTEAAALAAARENGRGDEMAPERIAAQAIHHAFSSIGAFQGEIVLGDPDGSGADPLSCGSRLGTSGAEVDVAVDPLEGGVSCALGGPNAMSIMALADPGCILRCPAGTYMDKIATGPDGHGVVDLDRSPLENLKRLAEARSCYVEDLTVVILDRPRHDTLIEQVREAGARVRLIPHGDVAAAMATAKEDAGVDMLLGAGGATQGVLSAAALKGLGGFMQCRFVPRSAADRDELYEIGIKDPSRKLGVDEMVRGHVLLAATGVTDGTFLEGVKFFKGGAVSHSVVMRSQSRTVRYLTTIHKFDYKPEY
ncbi:MAG TPA: class II fructose-bisphosphatase [Candidatus Limnocylindrales bacterium]|nr:class II fructose-bisphosphatase [Candidatus Limnocylindrales bacterium]